VTLLRGLDVADTGRDEIAALQKYVDEIVALAEKAARQEGWEQAIEAAAQLARSWAEIGDEDVLRKIAEKIRALRAPEGAKSD